MDSPTLILTELPELSDESAGQLLDFLNSFVSAFEQRYYTELQRYYQLQATPMISDLQEVIAFEDSDEPF